MKNRSIQVLEAALAVVKSEIEDHITKPVTGGQMMDWSQKLSEGLDALNNESSTIRTNEVKLMADKLKFLTELRHLEFTDTSPYTLVFKNTTIEVPLCEVRAVRKEIKNLIKNTMDRLIKELNDLGVET